MPQYLTLVELLVIHDRLLEKFGGAAGVRDGGALESAIFEQVDSWVRRHVTET